MQARTWTLVGGLAVGLATLLYMTNKPAPSDKQVKDTEHPECSKEKMQNILEDLRIEYTPYYTHFFHMLVALGSEYEDKPTLQKKLREKIKDRLEQKVEEI